MANELIKMKTGSIAALEHETNSVPDVPLDRGTIYFAVDTVTHKGKIVFDAPVGANGVDRIVMGTDSEYAENAENADFAEQAGALFETHNIDGINFNGTANVIHYNLCSTAAGTAAKTVECPNFDLRTGARITVKYANTNTAANPTLNVNNTGAKSIYYHNERIPVDALKANELHDYIYDGLNWVYVGTIAANVAITVDENSKTLFITSPIVNGDGVNY